MAKQKRKRKSGHVAKPRGSGVFPEHENAGRATRAPAPPPKSKIKRIRVIEDDEPTLFDKIRAKQRSPVPKDAPITFSHPVPPELRETLVHAADSIRSGVEALKRQPGTECDDRGEPFVEDGKFKNPATGRIEDDRAVKCDRCSRESMVSSWKPAKTPYGWPDIACPACGALGTAAEVRG